MMKQLFAFLWLSGGLFPALAQPVPKLVPMLLLDEDFRDNGAGWNVGATAVGRKTLDTLAGTYTLRREPAGGFYSTRSYPINYGQDFSIEAEVRGAGGLVWGREGDTYALLQLLPGAGRAMVVQVRDGQKREAGSTALPTPADWHRLRVARVGEELRYELDGTLVLRQPWLLPSGRGLGFYATGPAGEFSVRHLLVRHLAPPIRLAPDLPANLRRELLAPPVSDPALPDEHPLISADGQWLVFWRRMRAVSSFTPHQADHDVYLAGRLPDGRWGPAQALGGPINNAASNNAQWISADGQELLLWGRYQPDGSPLMGAGFSRSRRRADGTWSVPELTETRRPDFPGQKLSFCFDVGNTLRIFSRQLSADGPDADLFVQFRQPDGRYGAARSLGPTLNQVGGREITPFLAPDGVTLYFASDAHPGYGKQDIFVTRRLDESWTQWSEPLNLGPAVNTA